MTGRSLPRRGALAAALVAPALLPATRRAAAQGAAASAWSPSRPVRLIVTFAPGGSADLLARRLAEPLSAALGQPVVVENRPGAGGNLGMDALAKSPPDGHAVGIGAAGPHAINPAILGLARMPYDAARDFTPIVNLANQPNVLLAHPSVPASPPDAFVAWLRAHPEEPFASPGAGTTNHLTGLAFSQALGVRLQHAPYRGSAPAHADLVAGNVRLMVDNIATAAPLARDGRARAVGVSTAARAPLLPEVPTLAELGAAGLDLPSWQGLFGPAGMPPAALARWNAEANAALADPAVAAFLRDSGAVAVGGTADAFAAFLAAERPRWAALVRAGDVRPE